MFGGEGAAPRGDLGGETAVEGGAGGHVGFVAGQDVDVQVVVADVAEDHMFEAGGGKAGGVESEDVGKAVETDDMMNYYVEENEDEDEDGPDDAELLAAEAAQNFGYGSFEDDMDD